MGLSWFNNMTNYVTHMTAIRNFLSDKLYMELDDIMMSVKMKLVLFVCLTLLMLAICTTTYYLVYKVKSKVDMYSEEITRKTSTSYSTIFNYIQPYSTIFNLIQPYSDICRLASQRNFSSVKLVLTIYNNKIYYSKECPTNQPTNVAVIIIIIIYLFCTCYTCLSTVHYNGDFLTTI